MPGITNDFGRIELIDTLWNVNCRRNLPNSKILYELIDTLWNVNFINPSSVYCPVSN